MSDLGGTQGAIRPAEPGKIDQSKLIERIYEIAFEPLHLENLIEEWCLQTALADTLDPSALQEHLRRAEVFLTRLEPVVDDPATYLRGYEKFAAFVVGAEMVVKAANIGAEQAFGVRKDAPLSNAKLPEDVITYLANAVRKSVRQEPGGNTLLRADLPAQRGVILMRLQTLNTTADVIVVSTQFQWSAANTKLLRQAYDLTDTEVDIVRRLVDGLDTKAIAEQRNTKVGTTRGQIKSILSKMNLRSQADIVRIAVMLGEMPDFHDSTPKKPALSKDWLEVEVWKPFQSRTLPDGRKQTFHMMGPQDGAPILLSHLGSCMVRWTKPMLRLAFEENLRIICPIRAGYGQSALPKGGYDPLALTTEDTAALLDHLHISALPYVVQGSDYPLAAHFAALQPTRITALISLGGRPCLPGGLQGEAPGAWQRFFVSIASKAPQLAEFAAAAVMTMSRRIGPQAMLQKLCKDSAADTALLADPIVAPVLEANIALMSEKTSFSARAFSREYIAFQTDWSGLVADARQVPTRVVLATEDPTFDRAILPKLSAAYPWIPFETVENAGLALLYEQYQDLIPIMGKAARSALEHTGSERN